MEYTITNGQHYLKGSRANKAKGVMLSQAKLFATEEEALTFLQGVRAKYQDWYVSPVSQEKIAQAQCMETQRAKQATTTTGIPTKRCPIDPMIRKYIYRQSNGKCALCGKPVKYTDFTIDHIVPLSMGGENDIENFQCTCRTCNQFKSNILPEDFIRRVSDIYKHNAEKTHKRGFKRSIVKGILSLID